MSKVFFWAGGQSDGCSYYRCQMPAAVLAERGHDTMASPVMPNQWRDQADVIVGQRVCQPGPSSTWQALAKEGSSRLVLELDDDLLQVDPSNVPAWSFFSRPEIRDNLIANIRVADAITCTTEPLAEQLRPLNPNVHVVPNFIPQWLLHVSPPERDPEIVTVGWGGGASHAMDWAEAISEVTRFITRNASTELHVMGHEYPEVSRRVPRDRYRLTPWIGSVPEYYQSIDFSVGLAPLRPHVFNQSKSPIKALEYAALGIPVVASDFGPYADFVRHNETGFLCKYPYHFSGSLRELANDPELRTGMGARARAMAAEHTIESNIDQWEKALGI